MSSNLIIYETQDWQTKLQVKLEDETVWLTQDQMSSLFNRDPFFPSKPNKKIYEEWKPEKKKQYAKNAYCKFRQTCGFLQSRCHNLCMISCKISTRNSI